MQLVECPGCLQRFCSLCRRRPHHFWAQCEEVPEIQRKWHEWLRSGRDEFVGKLAERDEHYRAALESLQQRKVEQARMLKEAEAREAEFDEMEKWKAQHCKCCPGCHRVIERLSGCDSMVCGQNYHGGDVQNGCGHRFCWASAPAYTPQKASHIEKLGDAEEVKLPKIVAGKQKIWRVDGKRCLRCAMCKEAIRGPLFLCIDCYACCACLLCANGEGSASGRRHLPDSHVFKILWAPEELKDSERGVLTNAKLTIDIPPSEPRGTEPASSASIGSSLARSELIRFLR